MGEELRVRVLRSVCDRSGRKLDMNWNRIGGEPGDDYDEIIELH
ncbi:MAG: hypothetical protein ABIK62_02290 [candidate division WOR-3 bacterium]